MERDRFPPVQATVARPAIRTRTGRPVSVTRPIYDCETLLEPGEATGDVIWLKRAAPSLIPETWNMELRTPAGVSVEEALERGLEERSREFLEKGAEVRRFAAIRESGIITP